MISGAHVVVVGLTACNATRTERRAVLSGAVAWFCLLGAGSLNAQTIADSVADFSDVQGQRGWEYGYYAGTFDPTGFQHLPLFDTMTIGAPAWHRTWIPGGWVTLLFAEGGHPNGTVPCCGGVVLEDNWAVRRWVSSSRGPMTIQWLLRDRDRGCGNGVGASVFVDGVLHWSGSIANGDSVGLVSSLSVCAEIGTTVDFAIDPNGGNQLCDSTDFQIVIHGPIQSQPMSALTCPSGTATFSVTPAGTGPFTYQWQSRNAASDWVNISDGPLVGSGGTVLAAVSGSAGSTVSLQLHRDYAHTPEFHDWRCIVTNACGSATSNPAALTICVADTDDGSGTGVCDGGVTIDDLLYYLRIFEDGAITADVDDGSGTGTPDGGVTIDDLLYYLQRFEAGC